MKKRYYKLILTIIYLAVAVTFLWVALWYIKGYRDSKQFQAPKQYDATIVNQNVEFEGTDGNFRPYEISFLRIKNISFYTDNEYVYFRFGLGGDMPKDTASLPSYENDKLTEVVYSIDLDDNYFSDSGVKNPSSPEASLTVNMYGKGSATDTNQISVNGELIKGGPGHDYFVIRYLYNDILFNKRRDYIVFSAGAMAKSEKYPGGASSFMFHNKTLAATAQNDKEVLIDLSLKDVKY